MPEREGAISLARSCSCGEHHKPGFYGSFQGGGGREWVLVKTEGGGGGQIRGGDELCSFRTKSPIPTGRDSRQLLWKQRRVRCPIAGREMGRARIFFQRTFPWNISNPYDENCVVFSRQLAGCHPPGLLFYVSWFVSHKLVHHHPLLTLPLSGKAYSASRGQMGGLLFTWMPPRFFSSLS